MKKIIFSLIILVSALCGYAQPVVQRAGPSNTVKDARLMGGYNLVLPVYRDTTSANANIGVDSSGAIIYTYVTRSIWFRQHSPRKWVTITQNDPSISSVSMPNDTTLVLCNNNSCDTTIVHPTVHNIASVRMLSKTQIVVCDSVQTCDTLTIPTQQVNIYQNGVKEISPGIVEFGGNPLLHNTILDIAYNTLLLKGATVYNYPTQFQQLQRFGVGTGIASFLSNGGNVNSSLDYDNVVRLGVNYTSDDYGSGLTGYMGDKIGYWLGTNLTGNGSYGLRVDNPNSKFSGIFFHTLDTSYTDAITFFAKHPLNPNFQAPIATGGSLAPSRIMTLHDNKNITLYGYDSTTRNDGVLTKVLGTDEDGNVLLGTVASGVHGIDDVLAVGQSLTADRTLTVGAHNLFFDLSGFAYVSMEKGAFDAYSRYDVDHSAQFVTATGSSASANTATLYAKGSSSSEAYFKAYGTGANEIKGTLQLLTAPATVTDTTTYKPLVIDGSGNVRQAYWYGGGGGGSLVDGSGTTAVGGNQVDLGGNLNGGFTIGRLYYVAGESYQPYIMADFSTGYSELLNGSNARNSSNIRTYSYTDYYSDVTSSGSEYTYAETSSYFQDGSHGPELASVKTTLQINSPTDYDTKIAFIQQNTTTGFGRVEVVIPMLKNMAITPSPTMWVPLTMNGVKATSDGNIEYHGILDYTPSSISDSTYPIGTICSDDTYLYHRNSSGNWGKIAWGAF